MFKKSKKTEDILVQDALLKEISEDVKNDKMKDLWDRYGLFIIIFVMHLMTRRNIPNKGFCNQSMDSSCTTHPIFIEKIYSQVPSILVTLRQYISFLALSKALQSSMGRNLIQSFESSNPLPFFSQNITSLSA